MTGSRTESIALGAAIDTIGPWLEFAMGSIADLFGNA